jgi:hypothetical protein
VVRKRRKKVTGVEAMESEGARKSTRSTILYKQYSGTEWESREIQDGYRKVDISFEPGLRFAGG